jgi:integrase
MAHVERHHRKPCAREGCAHGFAKHGRSARGSCTVQECACSRWRAAEDDRETIRARWRDPAGRERSKTFARMLDANRFLVSIEDAKLRGAYVDPAAGKIPFGPWAERWYASTAHLKPSTRHDYRALLDHQVLPRFSQGSLASIDTLAVREWFSVLVAGDLDAKPPRKPIGAKRAHKALQVLVLILGAAVEGKKLATNPAAGLKRLPKAQRREMYFLDAPQVEVLAEVVREPYGTLLRFAAYTGLRPCELVALRVRQLNLLRGEVRVAEAAPEVGGKLQWGDVKTHEARTIHLSRWLSDELGTYLDGRPRGREDLVFTAVRGGPLRESKWVPGVFKKAVRAANDAVAEMPASGRPDELPINLRFYDLRHTCASLLIREGASIKAVQRHMGHKTAAITLDTYGHLYPDELPGLAERFERLHAEAVAGLPRAVAGSSGIVAIRPGATG